MRYYIFIFIFLTSMHSYADFVKFEGNKLKVGFYLKSFPYISRLDSEIGLKYWGEQLGKSESLNIDVDVNLYSDISIMREDFNSGNVNIIVAAPMAILKNFDRSLLADGFTVSHHGTATQNLVVITRKNENLDEFKNLSGKKVGLLENDDLAEAYLDSLSLTYLFKPYKRALIKPVWESKKSQLVLDLFFKKLDAIILYERSYLIQTELNPQLNDSTQIINRRHNIISGMGFFHKNVPEEFRKKVISYLLSLGSNPGDKFLLKIFQADKFESASIETLQPIEEFMAEYNKLFKQYDKLRK